MKGEQIHAVYELRGVKVKTFKYTQTSEHLKSGSTPKVSLLTLDLQVNISIWFFVSAPFVLENVTEIGNNIVSTI